MTTQTQETRQPPPNTPLVATGRDDEFEELANRILAHGDKCGLSEYVEWLLGVKK